MEEKLNELNIFALRDLARRTGVNSPTSKKKEVLIKEIMEILSGDKKPDLNKTKQGRPPKVFGYNFANVFNSNFPTENLSHKTLNQEINVVKNEEIITVAGWIELVNNNSAILWVQKNFTNENYFVPNEVLKNINVKMGDRIVAEVSAEESQKIVKKIFSVNDFPILQLEKNRPDYLDIEHCLATRKLEFSNKEFGSLGLSVGENCYMYGTDNNRNTLTVIEMLNNCQIENKIYINVSVAEKNKIYLSKLKNSENFIANITDEIDSSRRLVVLAIERIKRILETGENVLVVVDDLMSISGIDSDKINLVKNLVSVTKCGSNNGSITLICVMPNNSLVQVEKLADKRLKIVDGKIEKIN